MEHTFDLEGYLATLNWKDDVPKRITSPPILLRGFVRRQDGIGSHLPNLYDHIFSEYKYVSFSTPTDRRPFMHGFLQDIDTSDTSSLNKYSTDFEWICKYRNKENIHVQNPVNFMGMKLINVGGFCGNLAQEYDSNFLDFFKYKKQFNAELYLYLMWENKGFSQLEPLLNIYDHIIVTNTWLKKELLSKYPGLSVTKLEHIAQYYKLNASGSTENFIFGFSGGLWERKKVDVLLQAFDQIKTPTDLLKIHSRKQVNTEAMLQSFTQTLLQYGEQVIFQNQTLADHDFKEWWDTLNCYVFISAGEAYSITPRQALMQGTPVILSKNTSHLDLLDIPGILWVDCTEQTTAKYSGNADLGNIIGTQFEPNIQDVMHCMQEVKQNYDFWKQEAIKGGKILEKRTELETIKSQWSELI